MPEGVHPQRGNFRKLISTPKALWTGGNTPTYERVKVLPCGEKTAQKAEREKQEKS